ncbi:MAG: YfhO family protein [Verrucomicrobia bacterium]|nr:YfhO family protein [Verrucomicrobiota bacterium]
MSSSHLPSTKRDFLTALLILAAVLAVIFHKDFSPEVAPFSNDGPLGPLSAKSGEVPGGLAGVWQDLNWIGVKGISAPPNLATVLGMGGPLFFAKIYLPFSLFFLGLSAWFFFRQLRFHPAVCILGGLAAALNSNMFSLSCWGLPSRAVTLGGTFLALGALCSATRGRPWVKTILAGWAIGLGIMEGFDVGAIFSVYVAAFAFFLSLLQTGPSAQRVSKGFLTVAVVAFSAAFFAAHALSSLIGTQIQGVSGMKQDQTTKQQRWDQATMWSLPKVETFRVVVPGLFGYRMDTPEGGNYWGAVGQQPGVAQSRHSGSGEYAGVLVILVAAWGLFRSMQKKENPFTDHERRLIWFWGGATLLSLLFAFGRHAPFYQIIYHLPYFSTIRNPIKFMHPFHMGVVVLFGYGLQGIYRRCLEKNLLKSSSISAQIRAWWATASAPDKKWTIGAIAFVGASVLGFLLYYSSRRELARHLETAGFSGEFGAAIARFSFGEVGLFIVFAALAVVLLVVILSGALSGPRMKLAWISLGLLLTIDLARANTPWLLYWQIKEKYASNGVIDLLRQQPPAAQRVTARFLPHMNSAPAFLLPDPSVVYEWLQHHFQYYNIPSLDIIQMPRMPELDETYLQAFMPRSNTNLAPIGRLWQLTSTRYMLAAKTYLDALNQQVDPGQARFHAHTVFDFAPRPPLTNVTKMEDVTALTNAAGQYALIEFNGALPRAKLYSNWQVPANDQETLTRLTSAEFDPALAVLLAAGTSVPSATAGFTNQNPGAVTISSYAPKHIQLKSQASMPTVLLLNDKFDPDWNVTVDGKPETLLRCNFIMRGVHLPAGEHTIEFHFRPPLTGLYISLAAIAVGLVLCGLLFVSPKRPEISATQMAPELAGAHPKNRTENTKPA